MRSQKPQGSSVGGKFLAPTVNSYKLHLAGVKSMIPDRLTLTLVQRPLDLRLTKDLSKDMNMDSLRVHPPRQEGRLNAPGRSSRRHHTPVLAFVNEQTLVPSAAAVGGSGGGWTGDLGQQAHRVKHRRASRSAGTPSSHGSPSPLPPSADMAGDSFALGENSAPGFPIAVRSRDDCASNPERLDLDRRGLEECPPLEGMERLRLLNFQHNLLTRVQNLAHLRRLAFLDLYDNRVSDMSGVSALSCLRVLMLGRNRIKRICSLENLTQLDVLDLHSNQISRIEGVSHLRELRVLNLAGNSISRVDNLQGLDSLTELNLRHNCIVTVTEVDRLPCLQRLFLSCNSISSFDALACLADSCSLCELTLDGNPVAVESWYRPAALRCVIHLRRLDMRRITEEERRMACVLARKDEERKRENHRQLTHKNATHTWPQQYVASHGLKPQDSTGTSSKERRRVAIRSAAQQWEALRACPEQPAQNGAREDASPENSPAHSPALTNGVAAQDPAPPDEARRVSPVSAPERPAGGGENRLRSTSRPNSPRDPRLLDAGGPGVQILSLSEGHLAELDGDTLRLFGPGALEALERGWGAQTAGAVNAIAFRYIHYDAIVPTLPRIRVKFPNLAHLIFLETGVARLAQLAALAQVRRLDQLTLDPDGNPVVSLALWRPFLLYRLHHVSLQRVNGEEVTMEEMISAERLFGTLGHIAATETPRCRLLLLLEESRKRQLQFLLEGRGRRAGLSPDEQRENGRLVGEGLSRALFNYPSRDGSTDSPEEGSAEASERAAMTGRYLRSLVQRASDTSLKGEALHRLWPSVFAETVRDSVLEMRDRAAFRQASLARLSQNK